MTTPLSRVLLRAMEADLPCEARPFRRLAEQFGVTEAELLDALRSGVESGLVRRYGARVRHQSAGFASNVMVAWQVAADDAERAGAAMASHSAVSHCYERPAFIGFPYTLYTMAHGRSREQCEQVISELAQLSGLTDHVTLWTVREFKKATPCYSRLLAEEA